MVNHFRTLLANLSGGDGAAIGHEYIPENFRPVRLPSTLLRVRRALFGADPDRSGVNFRIRQYLPLLHRPDFEPLLAAFDSRITYSLDDRRLFDLPETPIFTITAGSASPVAYGTPPSNTNGRLEHGWTIVATDTNEIDISSTTTVASTSTVVTWANGLSGIISLPDGGSFGIRLSGTSIAAPTRIVIRLYTKPAQTLAEVAASLRSVITPDVAVDLFGDRADFRELWEGSTRLDDNLAGVLLGLGYATERVRGAA